MINTYKLKLTGLQQEIIRLMFVKTGTQLNQRQISKLLEVSQPAVMKALPELEKQELIKISQDKESKRWSVELNRENHKVMQLKQIDNLRQIYESGLADYLEEKLAGSTIILFGSYSRGEDTITSDIDIAVIGRKEKELKIEKFENDLERKINVNFYETWDIHKNLKENLCNGIVLAGGVKL
ncbi:MAG: nucleotidyltransferase domain-containing protein [Nanoarchaeota archaeon]|nr:nucleotidyltransferase domain-containing protein [Nanoarchaeota archaeon]